MCACVPQLHVVPAGLRTLYTLMSNPFETVGSPQSEYVAEALRIVAESHREPLHTSLNSPVGPYSVAPSEWPCEVCETQPTDVLVWHSHVWHASMGGGEHRIERDLLGDGIADLVCNAGREFADGGQALRMQELILHTLALGNVVDHQDQVLGVPVGALIHGGLVEVDHAPGTVSLDFARRGP